MCFASLSFNSCLFRLFVKLLSETNAFLQRLRTHLILQVMTLHLHWYSNTHRLRKQGLLLLVAKLPLVSLVVVLLFNRGQKTFHGHPPPPPRPPCPPASRSEHIDKMWTESCGLKKCLLAVACFVQWSLCVACMFLWLFHNLQNMLILTCDSPLELWSIQVRDNDKLAGGSNGSRLAFQSWLWLMWSCLDDACNVLTIGIVSPVCVVPMVQIFERSYMQCHSMIVEVLSLHFCTAVHRRLGELKCMMIVCVCVPLP